VLQGSLLFVAVIVYAVTVRRSQASDIEAAARAAVGRGAPPTAAPAGIPS
jgi:hypothetical protein